MPLRLRRGTDTERQLITPQEGELIYVTDTKELWAGDGTTQGGVKVTGNIPENLNDLDDIDLSVAPQIGQVLKWNGTAFVAANDNDTDTDTAGIVEGSNYRINIVADDSTIMVNTTNQSFIGNLEGNVFGNLIGDVQGSVFADDSNLIIDGLTGDIVANFYKPTDGFLEITNEGQIDERLRLIVSSINGRPKIYYKAILNGTTTSRNDPFEQWAGIYFQCDDDDGNTTSVAMNGGPYHLSIAHDSTGGFADESFTYYQDGKLGIGSLPTEKLEVSGNTKVSGFVQFGSFTKTERDNLTAANGMVLYNTTSNRFQGYQNGAWINLDDGTADP